VLFDKKPLQVTNDARSSKLLNSEKLSFMLELGFYGNLSRMVLEQSLASWQNMVDTVGSSIWFKVLLKLKYKM
jgi:hypothetical protein